MSCSGRADDVSWPTPVPLPANEITCDEEREISIATTYTSTCQALPYNRHGFFDFSIIVAHKGIPQCYNHIYLLTKYWIITSQNALELQALKANNMCLPNNSVLKALNLLLNSFGIICVGGRISNAELCYSRVHSIILHCKHPITKLIIASKHRQMLNSLLSAYNFM